MNIIVTEKPDWVSWEEIKECLSEAHAENRRNGINMSYPSQPAGMIRDRVGEDGKMFVALDGRKVVGTASVRVKNVNNWFHTGRTAYFGFGAVHPEYQGKGVYKKLSAARYEYLATTDLRTIFMDTHLDNKHIQHIFAAQGFKYVDLKRTPDHFSVRMFKWLDGCPYSDFKCRMMYFKRYWAEKLRYAKSRFSNAE